MQDFHKHIITNELTVRQVLSRLDILASDAILFLVNEEEKLIGSLTDGDIRRGLIKGLGLEDKLIEFIQSSPKFFRKGEFDLLRMKEWREKNFKVIPVLDQNDRIVDIVNFRLQNPTFQ